METTIHLDRCHWCRLVHHDVARAMRAFRARQHMDALLHLYAGLDLIASGGRCDRGMTILTDAATEMRVILDRRQPALIAPAAARAKV